MKNNNTVLLIGNGFTIDFVKHKNIYIDSTKPLSNFNVEQIEYPFLKHLPTIKDTLIPLSKELDNDFEAIRIFLKAASESEFGVLADVDLRRFLAVSYSYFNNELDKYSIVDWGWYKWLKKYSKHLRLAISFNYELLLERTLKLVNPRDNVQRVGVINEKLSRIPIIKPHGSIDFDIFGFGVSGETVWTNYFTDCESFDNYGNPRVQAIDKGLLLEYRMQPDIIPPTQENYNINKLKWVNYCYRYYDDFSKKVDVKHFVLAGHSYAECDREEIDYFISQIKPGCKFYIINPNYDESMILLTECIKRYGHIVVTEPGYFKPPILEIL